MKSSKLVAVCALLQVGGSVALADDAQNAIVSAGTTVASYAGAAGAAGVAVMVVLWGIRVAVRGLKSSDGYGESPDYGYRHDD